MREVWSKQTIIALGVNTVFQNLVVPAAADIC